MGRKNLIYLTLIVLVGLVLRLSSLTWNPPSLNWDEISHGYNAYSILKTGMDQWGQKFPLINFRAYGDYPTTLNLYLTIPFIIFFGLTDFAIRFPHVLLGTLTIVSVYFLVYGLTKQHKISLLAAFLTAIGPWYVFTSRFVLQSNLSVFLLITSAALFVNKDKKGYFFCFSLLLFTLTLFAYHTTRVFSPLFLFGGLLIYKDQVKNKFILGFAACFFFVATLVLVNPGATARGSVLFLIDQGAVNDIEVARNTSNLPSIITKFLYNRPVYFVTKFSRNYISYFSPKFLFLKGGTQYQFSVPGYGLIYPVSLPFFYIGLALLVLSAFTEKKYKLLLLWILLAPVPASLTNENYTVLRATTMLPVPEVLISIGFYWFLGKLPSKTRVITSFIYIALILYFALNYFVNYFTSYRLNYSWSWQYGYKEVVNYVEDHYSEYDKIIITKKYGEPHEYLLFYLNYDPGKYQNDSSKIAFFKDNWYWVDRFDKFYFVNDWQVADLTTESKMKIDCQNSKCLLISSPDNFPNGFSKIHTVDFLDGNRAFEIYNNR